MKRAVFLHIHKQVEESLLLLTECTWNNAIRQIEIRTAEPLAPEASAFDVETDIEKLKRHKSTGTDHVPGELIHA
jgi:hypothetical protein